MWRITIFLSAFLLFQEQPIMGRYALPWFGGGPAVWTTCLLFFQTLLLVGYGYAHWLGSRRSVRVQAVAHLSLLAASLLLLPIAPRAPEPGSDPNPRDSTFTGGEHRPTMFDAVGHGSAVGSH